MNKKQAREALGTLLSTHAREMPRMDEIHAYLQPWSVEEAARRLRVPESTRNYKLHSETAKMSQTPFLNLVIDSYGQSLKVEGFYNGNQEKSPAWEWWQRNRMAARQTGLHRAALTYGTSYASVVPAAGGGVKIGTYTPRKMVALYTDDVAIPGYSGEYPILAAEIGDQHIKVFDEERVWIFGVEKSPYSASQWNEYGWMQPENLPFIEYREHNLGVTPIIRYQDIMLTDGEQHRGIVEPLMGLSDRINRTNYEQSISQHFAAFKQRYVIGWLPQNEMEAFKQNASATQYFESEKVKVGQFDETDLSGYIEARRATIQDLAAVAQVPAQALGAQAISNISADGLAALETSKDRKSSEIQTSLGESHEQLMRLTSYVIGDEEGASDFSSEAAWAETSARSFAQTVDGLGKLQTMLGVPAEELWSDIPGWTRERVERAQAKRNNTRANFSATTGLTGLFTEED